METRETLLKSPEIHAPLGEPVGAFRLGRAGLGLGLLLGCLGLVASYIHGYLIGKLLVVAVISSALLVGAYQVPALLLAAILVVAPFNYGSMLGGATVKLSELVVVAMGAVTMLRMAAGDEQVFIRFRRAALPIAALTVLAVLAVVTASAHPNFFNVRYEVENYLVCIYAILFFRRAWWPRLLILVLATLALESVATLGLRFVFGLSGVSFFNTGGGMDAIQFSAEDLENFAGGQFRLSGTFGHKNMLAAFFVLALPLVSLEALHRKRPAWLFVIVPALATLALTDSMTGWTAIILAVVLALIHLRRFDYLALLMLMVLPVAGFGLYKFGDSVFSRIDQLLAGQEGWNTVSSRQQIFEISKRLLGEYPWTGIGRNNFLAYGQTYYAHGHNLFLMKAIEMGIPAGFVFALVIVAIMGRTWKTILCETRRLATQQQYYRTLGLWLGCLGFLSMNLFDYNYAHFSLGPLFMGMLGILLSVAMDLESLGERAALSARS